MGWRQGVRPGRTWTAASERPPSPGPDAAVQACAIATAEVPPCRRRPRPFARRDGAAGRTVARKQRAATRRPACPRIPICRSVRPSGLASSVTPVSPSRRPREPARPALRPCRSPDTSSLPWGMRVCNSVVRLSRRVLLPGILGNQPELLVDDDPPAGILRRGRPGLARGDRRRAGRVAVARAVEHGTAWAHGV
jgi:hypothetical protein